MEYVNEIIASMAVTHRNRDLDKTLTQEQIEYFCNLAVQTPRKQSNKYFDVYGITNQQLIKKIYEYSAVPDPEEGSEYPQPYNSQIFAPLLILWIQCDLEVGRLSERYLENMIKEQVDDVTVDTHQSVGISAGVVAYESNRLGFKTGFCRCIDELSVRKELSNYGFDLLSGDNNKLLLSLSIGYPKFTDPRQHQIFNMSYQPHNKVDSNIFYIF